MTETNPLEQSLEGFHLNLQEQKDENTRKTGEK
jgi:hypothetical protein